MWSGQTGFGVREIEVSKKAAVMGLAFSPDGRRLATATLGQPSLRIWSVDDGQLLRELSGSSDANSISFSGDGRLIAVAGLGTSSVWDANTGERLLALPGSSGSQVAFAPDSRTFYMSSADGLVRAWRYEVCVSLEELKRDAAKRVMRGLTMEERLLYLGRTARPELGTAGCKSPLGLSDEPLRQLADTTGAWRASRGAQDEVTSRGASLPGERF